MATEYAKTKKYINRLGFGAWQLGNTDFWGYMSFDEGVELVKQAYQKGIRFFDTAPGYASGMSETILGTALNEHRDQVVINTKFGHTADGETDFSVFSLREQIYASLERLQTNYLDSILLHNPSFEILEGKTLHFQELEKIKEEGLIKAYGVSIDTYEELETVLKHVKLDVIEILFNIFFQDAIPLLKKAHDQGVSIIAKVPLDSGWLTGKYDETSEFEGIRSRWDDETIARRAKLIKEVKKICKSDQITKYAISFILSFNEVTAVIPGIKNSEQLDDHLNNAAFEIPEDMKQKLIKLFEKNIKHNPLSW